MKIVVLATHFHKGGAEKQLGYIARELARNGAEVLHVSIARQDLPAGGTLSGLSRVSLGIECFRSFQLFIRVFGFLRRERPDAVLSCVTPCDFMAFLWKIVSKAKWVMREPNTYDAERVESPLALRRWLGRWADCVVSNNHGGHAFWQHIRGTQPTYMVPNLTYVDTVRELAKDTSEQINIKSPYFICVGRLEEQKNFQQAIQGFAAFSKKHSEYKLVVVGAGSQREKLLAEAQQSGVADSVLFTGYLSNPLPLIGKAKGLILPSRFEGCPNVAMEAAMLNTPLILSSIAAHRALFDEDMVHYFQLDAPDQTANALEKTLDKPEPGFKDLLPQWGAELNGLKYYDIIKKTVTA